MYERSKIYRRLVFPAGTDPSQLDPISRTIHSIVVLNEAESARPLLMYVMEALAAGTITEAQALEMLNACLSLVFRAKVTKSTGINGQFAGNVLQRLRRQSQDNEVERFWKAITAGSGRFAFPSDELFRSSLIDRPIFDVLRAKGTKYLFYELERQTMASKGLPSYNDVNITTEHVMPQRLSEAWRDELGDEAEHHDEYLNRIGNLTLTSNNPEMSNKPFEEKKAWYAESSFHLTRQLGKVDGWSIGRIRKRSSQLADACVETWAFPKQYQSGTDPVEHAGKRRPNFQFSFVDLEPGDEVALLENPSKVAVVIDDRHVGYHGMTYTLTGLAKKLLHTDAALSGPEHFTYDGEKLSEMRDRIESNLL